MLSVDNLRSIAMLIRNFIKPVHSIDDIRNIPERRRFVIIYKYPDGPHKTMFEIYQNDIYDLYLINMSTLVGIDYIIPKDMIIQYRNTYRGKIVNPFNLDGSFNLNSFCAFNTASFATRIVNGIDVIRLTKRDLISNGTYENHIANIMKCDTIIPFPTYYNVEDQARLTKGDFQKMDFELYLNDTPQYTLNDFRDAKTTFISLDIHEDNLFNNQRQFERFLYGFNNQMAYDFEEQSMTNIIKDHFMAIFLDCYDIIMRSIFAQAYIIIDLESGLITVNKETLTLKYTYKITKEEIIKEYAHVLQEIDEISESFDVFSTDYLSDRIYQFENIPSRMMIYISPARCKIKLVYSKEKKLYNMRNVNITSEYSSSDTEEGVLAKETGESMFCEYMINDDEPF
jgi:hypothetical protein